MIRGDTYFTFQKDTEHKVIKNLFIFLEFTLVTVFRFSVDESSFFSATRHFM